jgi:hypothetical protein
LSQLLETKDEVLGCFLFVTFIKYMKKVLFFCLLITSFHVYSQKEFSNVVLNRTSNRSSFRGFAIGFLVQGQLKYPYPYYGPEVNGLYNDGAYHYMIDFYIKKFLVGFQVTDEYLYLQKNDSNAVWKPRGFNGSFTSLTRAYWISLGYNIYDEFNFKLSIGFRNGPKKSFLMTSKSPSEIAVGFNYNDPSNLLNEPGEMMDGYSEIDFSASINYPIKLYRKIAAVPEIGYSFKHGGLITGMSFLFLN